jgi:hypothetical protein
VIDIKPRLGAPMSVRYGNRTYPVVVVKHGRDHAGPYTEVEFEGTPPEEIQKPYRFHRSYLRPRTK